MAEVKLRHYLSGMHKCASPSTPMWSTNSRRIDPINLSAKPVCQGEPGAMGLSRMPMVLSRRATAAPWAWFRSRARSLIPRECLRDLVCDPLRSWTRCDVDPDKLSASQPHDDQDVERRGQWSEPRTGPCRRCSVHGCVGRRASAARADRAALPPMKVLSASTVPWNGRLNERVRADITRGETLRHDRYNPSLQAWREDDVAVRVVRCNPSTECRCPHTGEIRA